MSNRSLVRAGLFTVAWIFSVLLVVDSFNRAWAANCGDSFNGPGTVTLDSDVGPCSGTGIVVKGATLNMAGHTVSCDGSPASIGVSAEGTTVQVSGGTVTNCNIGFDWDTDGGSLTKNKAMGNQVGFLLDGDNVNATKNTATGNQTGFLIKRNSHTVKGNVAKGNNAIGFQIEGDGSMFEKNTADGNQGEGFDVKGASNTLAKNTATGNHHQIGFFVDGDRNKLTSNTATSNLSGIGINGEFNTLEQNTADTNGVEGIFINAPFAGNLVSANKATKNDISDLFDANDECTSNKWKHNKFRTKNPSCIH
jgi:parallel beta-helix repeat protein